MMVANGRSINARLPLSGLERSPTAGASGKQQEGLAGWEVANRLCQPFRCFDTDTGSGGSNDENGNVILTAKQPYSSYRPDRGVPVHFAKAQERGSSCT
jgi:hypothetical protein